MLLWTDKLANRRIISSKSLECLISPVLREIYVYVLLVLLFLRFLNTDTRPPVLNCPPNLKVNTLKGKSTGKVTWSVQVPDNSGDVDPNAVIKIESNHKSGQELPIRVTAIRVTATDQAGNEAICTFEAEVIGNIQKCIGGNFAMHFRPYT